MKVKEKKKKRKEKNLNREMKRNRGLYILLLAGCFVFVCFFGGFIPYMLFYLILFAPLVFAFFMLLSTLQIKCRQEMDKKTINKGDEVSYTCTVTNRGFLPIPATTAFWKDDYDVLANEKQAGYHLLPFQSESKGFKISFPYRGLYEFGISHFVILDYLGLCRKKLVMNDLLSVTVFPRLIEISSFSVVHRLETLLGQNFISNDNEEFADIRNYHYGDPLNRIHWNLFAQKDGLFSKIYDSHHEWDVVILLDLTPIEAENRRMYEDYLIECCLAAVFYCQKQKCKLRLVYCLDGMVHTVIVRNNFEMVYRSLAYLPFSAALPLEDQTGEFTTANAAVIFTARELTPGFIDSLTHGCMKEVYRLLTAPGAKGIKYENTGNVWMHDMLVTDSISGTLEKSL